MTLELKLRSLRRGSLGRRDGGAGSCVDVPERKLKQPRATSWECRPQGRDGVPCWETTPTTLFCILGSHFPRDGEPTEMCCAESSQGSKGSKNQMSELLRGMRAGEAGNKGPLLPPSNGSKAPAGWPGAGAGRSLEGGPGGTNTGQAGMGGSRADRNTGFCSGSDHWATERWATSPVCAPPQGGVGGDWLELAGRQQQKLRRPMTLRSVLPALDAFDFLCEVRFHRTERGHSSGRVTFLSLKRLWGLSILRDTG